MTRSIALFAGFAMAAAMAAAMPPEDELSIEDRLLDEIFGGIPPAPFVPQKSQAQYRDELAAQAERERPIHEAAEAKRARKALKRLRDQQSGAMGSDR